MNDDTPHISEPPFTDAEHSQRELERRIFHLKTLYEVSQVIGSLRDPQQIMKNLLLMVIGTFGALKGVAFLVYSNNVDYLPIIRAMYPGGAEEVIKSQDGIPRFTSYKLTREQMAAFQTLNASYRPAQGSEITRAEPITTNPGAVRRRPLARRS